MGVGAGGSFNQILTNGIVNAKYVVVIPYISGSNSGVVGNLPPYQTLFDTAPGTTTPLAAITQFQVQVGGQNIFQQNFQYDFENFVNEVSAMNAINGGISTGLTNGLISSLDWENGYRYYVCDISRRLPSEDAVPRSVVISGINGTGSVMDYICFIVFERRITLEMVSGEVIG